MPMKFLRKRAVSERVGFHPSHIMRLARAGKFPQAVQLGPNSIAFVEEEVEAWQQERAKFRKATQTDERAEFGSGAA